MSCSPRRIWLSLAVEKVGHSTKGYLFPGKGFVTGVLNSGMRDNSLDFRPVSWRRACFTCPELSQTSLCSIYTGHCAPDRPAGLQSTTPVPDACLSLTRGQQPQAGWEGFAASGWTEGGPRPLSGLPFLSAPSHKDASFQLAVP